MNSINKLCSLFAFSLIPNYVFFTEPIGKNIVSQANINEVEEIGNSKLKLMGQFNGIGANIDSDKYYFSFDTESQSYFLKVKLTKGDIFYIYQYEKTRAFYYPIFNQKACDAFESIGLTRSPYSGSFYFWAVELTGEYEIRLDYHAENIEKVWDIWNEEYSSSIVYGFKNDSVCCFVTEFNDKNKYQLMTKNKDGKIFQYGKNFGTFFEPSNKIKIYQKEKCGIIRLEYDSRYGEELDLFILDENDVSISQFTFPLKHEYCYFSLNSLEGNNEFGKTASILFEIDKGISKYTLEENTYDNCILSLSQIDAKRIIDDYDMLDETNKNIVDKSSITYIDSSFNLKQNAPIKNVIDEIREISRVPFVFPILAIIIPLGVLTIGGIGTFFLLYFKKRDS